MAEHVHGCLSCKPDMVPNFDRDDPRYHGIGKCLHGPATINGSPVKYTAGMFGGSEPWALVVEEDVHFCPCSGSHGTPRACVRVVFGSWQSECRGRKSLERYEEAKLVEQQPDEVSW